MSLNEIVANSNYVTDEDLMTANILGIANTAIAEVNAKCGTKLHLFPIEALTESDAYTELSDSWLLSLIEPYLSYSIMANDGNDDAMNFHYNRFLKAIEDFKNNGIKDLDSSISGDLGKQKTIDVSDVTMHWRGWI